MEKITQKEYNNIHNDFKGIWKDGIYRVLKLENWKTISKPVIIV